VNEGDWIKTGMEHNSSQHDPDVISVFNEFPLGSVPSVLKLLHIIEFEIGKKLLDIGWGRGFPLTDITEGLIPVFVLDPGKAALQRARLKRKSCYKNTERFIPGKLENMPFASHSFHKIFSNNGINNARDVPLALSECFRVSQPGAQFVLAYNLEKTMIEFYDIFETVLNEAGMHGSISKLKEHIYQKHKPLDEMKVLVQTAGFKVTVIETDMLKLHYKNAAGLFHHPMIKYWFLHDWKKIAGDGRWYQIFDQIKQRLDTIAKRRGKISLSIPFAVINAFRR